ncbi:S8 family serine peptidase [Saccharicrinis aurantiacus]|uniref:S8 family serine peptidase n=1 Tax=Saccharicrinis aurantiacus TaxID=1849719 RepID=UPI00094FC3E5|nr:S8 family serine peptidase [Saccharicrinis aurantiacus]
MRKVTLFILLIISCITINIDAQKYFVSFTDKNSNDYSLSAPQEFLSPEALERRTNQNIELVENDLPVTSSYLTIIQSKSVKVLHTSKWLNGAIIESSNAEAIDEIKALSFVSKVDLIWKPQLTNTIQKNNEPLKNATPSAVNVTYGNSWTQTAMVKGQYVHQNYNGEGINIAVLDAGFKDVNSLPSFVHLWENNQILDAYDFVNPTGNIFQEHQHGMQVLSIIGGYVENEFKGSAIKSNFFLYRTEDAATEYPVEEYYWVCAAEKADSIGADIISSSLGYYEFDDSNMSYTYADMDGQTSTIVKAAEIAFSKGIIVVNSAGNEGDETWRYIISPADGENVLTVGAVDSSNEPSYFSSFGPTADGRVKPDVVALGSSTAIQGLDGNITRGNGTSFSAPVITGFTACIKQALPQLSNQEIITRIKESAHLISNPTEQLGYGIPNFADILDIENSVNTKHSHTTFTTYNNPFTNSIHFNAPNSINSDITIKLYNISGTIMRTEQFAPHSQLTLNNLNQLSKGIYIAQITYNNQSQTIKLTKQ